jgi:N-ethylmaleimide reductase
LVNRSARSLALKDRGTAEAWLEQGKADLIAFGCKFLANPDLPDRFRAQAAQCRRSGHLLWRRRQGYTDYPSLAQERGEQPKACVDDRWR